MPRRTATPLALLYSLATVALCGQPTLSQREDAEARIFIIQELSLNRVRDLDFGTLFAGEISATVDPRTNARAGKFLLQFDDTQEWTVRYQASAQLTPQNGAAGAPGLPFSPAIFGHPSDAPGLAAPVEPGSGRYRTQNGRFYFWIGGEIRAANARPGTYTGVFTLTVEAI